MFILDIVVGSTNERSDKETLWGIWLMSENKRPWEISTFDYIGRTNLPEGDSDIVRQVRQIAADEFGKIRDLHIKGDIVQDGEPIPVTDGYSLAVMTSHDAKIRKISVFIKDDTGEIVGSPRVGMSSPYVTPEHRRNGITSGFNWIQDMNGNAFRTLGYTPEGLESRAATHRLHVERALERGDFVPEDVLSEYVVDENGKVSRPVRYTPEVYNAELERRPPPSDLFDFDL